MLTPKQSQLLEYIDQYIKKSGSAPSFEEMKVAVGLKSKSGIHRLINGLIERGYLRQLKKKARALEVIKSVNAPATDQDDKKHQALSIPLYGKIAAGSPISALADLNDHIDIPQNFDKGKPLFALTVEGDSMVEAGIVSGDVALIEKADDADDNEIVVALINDEEATLKRIRKDGQIVTLIPANRLYPALSYTSSEIKVQGRMVGLYRRY